MPGPDQLDSTLTVFLGRGRLSHGIRQTLEDFTVTGLIRDLVWVDADSFENSASPVTHLRMTEEGNPEITRAPFNALVSKSGTERLNLGVINTVGAGDTPIGSTELAALDGAIDSVGSGHRTHRTNLIITAVDVPMEGKLPILRGYTNLLLAPEDSPGPDSATVPYHFDALDNRFTLHCVAGIASLFGVWEGSTSAVVENFDPGSGQSLRLVRAFYRRIDGQAVQARLKSRILDTTVNPLPKLDRPGQEVSAQYTEAPAAFANGAAEELLTTFDGLLIGETAEAVTERTRVVNSRRAIGDFLRDWGKNLLTTPARFWRNLRAESGAFVDDTVQSTLFGDTGSATRVGGSAIGESGWGGTDAARGQATSDFTQQAAAQLGPVWMAYANTSMSLLDAQPRWIGSGEGDSVPKVVQDHASSSRVQVAQRAADVIPGPAENFGADLPVGIKAMVDGGEIQPYDRAGAEDYERRLASQATGRQRDIGRVVGDFKRWRQEHADSFAAGVGRGLNTKLTQQQQRERDLVEETERYRSQEQQRTEDKSRAAGVFRWLGWVAFWSLALFALVWWIMNLRASSDGVELARWAEHLNDASTQTKGWLFGTWFAIWLLSWLTQVFLETRIESIRRNRRHDIVGKRTAAERNLAATRDSIIRLQVAYQQFLSTSQLMGALLERPFGLVGHQRVESTIPTNTMPDSVVFAEATPDDAVVDRVAEQFRRDIYQQGWLNAYVMGGMSDAAGYYSERTGSRMDESQVFRTTGRGTGGALARFADWVVGEEFFDRDRSGEKWAAITAELGTRNRRDDAVLSPLQIYRDGQRHTAPQRTPLRQGITVGSFNGEIATERGRVDGVLNLDDTLCTYDHHPNAFDAIGVSEALIQVGRTAAEEDVAFRRPETGSTRADVLARMPVTEDAQPEAKDMAPAPQPRHQLPGMGEF